MSEVMTKEYNWHIDYRVSVGSVYTKFFEGLKNKRIIGNKCPECGNIYIPVKTFCDKCFVQPTEWIEAKQRGTVQGFTVTFLKLEGLPDPPYISAIIKIDNSAVSLIHFLGGIDYKDQEELPSKIHLGMAVEPVWEENRKGDMLDIKYFKPISEV